MVPSRKRPACLAEERQLEPVTTAPRVLFVYFTYTHQTGKLVEAMGEALGKRGWDVHTALIELADERYAKRFSKFPMKHPLFEVLTMLVPELRHAKAAIRIPDEVGARDYDLVVIGSPTWWLSTSVPIRSFLASEEAGKLLKGKRFTAFVACRRYWKHNLGTVRKMGTAKGGTYVEGTHYAYQGGQVRSLLSLVSYLGSGKYRERFLGIRIPPTNLIPAQLDEARVFADGLANTRA